MKNLLSFITIALLFGACDPPRDIYQSGGFTFPVTVINPRDTITLGDSVCFIFKIPDTINLNGNNRIKPFYSGNDGASFPVADNEIDTTLTGGARPFSPNIDEYASLGNTQGGLNFKSANGNTLETKYYLIPKRRGVFFLELAQAGYVDANNGGLKARAVYTLNVPDRHHNLLITSTLPRHGMAAYIQGRQNLGLEIYAFAVK